MVETATTGDASSDGDGAAADHAVIVKIGARAYPLAVAEALCRRQATGFYWIAGLSIVNAVAIASTSASACTSASAPPS